MAIIGVHDTPLSRDRTLTHPLFPAGAKTEDVSSVVIKSDVVGEHYPNLVIPGVPGLAFSLTNGSYSADGADAPAIDATYSGATLWVKLTRKSTVPITMEIPQDGIVADTSGSVNVLTTPLVVGVTKPSATVAGGASVVETALSASFVLPPVSVDIAGGVSVNTSALSVHPVLGVPVVSAGASVAETALHSAFQMGTPTVAITTSTIRAKLYLNPDMTLKTTAPADSGANGGYGDGIAVDNGSTVQIKVDGVTVGSASLGSISFDGAAHTCSILVDSDHLITSSLSFVVNGTAFTTTAYAGKTLKAGTIVLTALYDYDADYITSYIWYNSTAYKANINEVVLG